MMKKVKDLFAGDAENALARDISRFKTLHPNGEAKIREDAKTYFSYLNSAEMIALAGTQSITQSK